MPSGHIIAQLAQAIHSSSEEDSGWTVISTYRFIVFYSAFRMALLIVLSILFRSRDVFPAEIEGINEFEVCRLLIDTARLRLVVPVDVIIGIFSVLCLSGKRIFRTGFGHQVSIAVMYGQSV